MCYFDGFLPDNASVRELGFCHLDCKIKKMKIPVVMS